MPAPAASGGWTRPGEEPARYRYVQREREEYAARRALFLQTYRLSTPTRGDTEEDQGLRGRLARRLREARVAGRGAVARAASRARGAARWWRGWRPRAHPHRVVFGCFGAGRKYQYLHGFA